jgi:hypothetical protein
MKRPNIYDYMKKKQKYIPYTENTESLIPDMFHNSLFQYQKGKQDQFNEDLKLGKDIFKSGFDKGKSEITPVTELVTTYDKIKTNTTMPGSLNIFSNKNKKTIKSINFESAQDLNTKLKTTNINVSVSKINTWLNSIDFQAGKLFIPKSTKIGKNAKKYFVTSYEKGNNVFFKLVKK